MPLAHPASSKCRTGIQWVYSHKKMPGRNATSEATAKTAMTGELLGKSPPKRRRPGNYLGSHCQNGNDRGTIWEVTAKTATTGELLGKSPPKWR